MASIYKRKDSRYWQCAFRDRRGVQISRSTKLTNRREAMQFAVGLERVARDAQKAITSSHVHNIVTDLLRATGHVPDAYTISGWFRFWLTNKTNSKAPGTVARYQGVWTSFQDFLGKRANLPLETLTEKDVLGFRNASINQGISAASANLILKSIRGSLNAAVAQGHIIHNPANAVDLLPTESSMRDKFTHDQIEGLLDAADSEEWKGLILMGYFVGARLGTCVKLAFENVDFKKATVTFVPEKQQRSKVPKSMVVPLHPQLTSWLRTQKRTTGPIFPTLSKLKTGGMTGLSLTFRALMEKAGIECTVKNATGMGRKVYSLSFHSLRHTFNSDLANANVTQEIRRKLIGHASDRVNDIYTHVEMTTLRTAISTLPPIGVQIGSAKEAIDKI